MLSGHASVSINKVPKITQESPGNGPNYTAPYFPLLGFVKCENNPILGPNLDREWESAHVYNPAAIVVDDRVWLLYRAQNNAKTSSIGLAWSEDGYHFTRYDEPVLWPTEPYEMPGGCEDPRIVRIHGTFYLTYTGWDNVTARLCLATSTDLVSWKKYGPILPDATDVIWHWDAPLAPYVPRQGWSKSGVILDEKVNGVWHMLFGDSFLYHANSTDLIHWNFDKHSPPFAQKLNVWEQGLMESAAPPVKTRDGMWLQIYNGVATGAGRFRPGQYSTGQMLIDPVNSPFGPPAARLEMPILQPESPEEVGGQTKNVVFSEGLVQYRGQWFLYFGQGDSFVGVATAPVQP